MTTMWKVVYGSSAPVEVQAEIPSYPNRDATGAQIFENTHFLDLDKAWKHHLAEHRAGLSLTSARVIEAREQLAKREASLTEAALFYNAALKSFDQFSGAKK